MINNSTNINKINNHLSPETIEHKKKPTTYDAWNPDPGTKNHLSPETIEHKKKTTIYDIENSGPEMEQPQKCN